MLDAAGSQRNLVLFPEMDETCRRTPRLPPNRAGASSTSIRDDVMCATSRMVVKRKAAAAPVVLPCTLLPYDAQFELGATLAEASTRVNLNHPHCARFCVLGGGSCSAPA